MTAELSTSPPEFCPACGYRIGSARWCLQCGWQDDTKPAAVRRMDLYMKLAFGSFALMALIAAAVYLSDR